MPTTYITLPASDLLSTWTARTGDEPLRRIERLVRSGTDVLVYWTTGRTDLVSNDTLFDVYDDGASAALAVVAAARAERIARLVAYPTAQTELALQFDHVRGETF